MKKKKRIALALAAALMMVLLLAACSDKTIRLGVAGIGGVYQVFGEDYAALQAQNGGRKLEVRETAGSAASLRLLSSGYLQMAVVQADMAQDAYNQTGAFAESEVENNFSTVAVLYQEECHIVVRADSGINTVEELQGKTVSIGEEESGTEQNARQILAAYGLDEKLVKEVNLNYTDAAKQLQSGEIDALFCTSGVKTEMIEELANSCGIALLPVDGSAAARLLAAYPAYSQGVIPAGSYNGQDQDVPTIGVKAVLLASDELSENTVKALTKTLYDGVDTLQAATDALLTKVRRKYKEYGINEKPFVVIKPDNGTYGMGIMTVRDAKELDALNRKTKNKMAVIKDGQTVSDVIIQEGVLTQERVNDAVAEPVVYMMDRYVVGGFYRMHAERGVDENLNSPGASFVPLAFEHSTHMPQPGVRPGVSAPNRFYMYGVVARLAMLAASYELEATDPDAEVYD